MATFVEDDPVQVQVLGLVDSQATRTLLLHAFLIIRAELDSPDSVVQRNRAPLSRRVILRIVVSGLLAFSLHVRILLKTGAEVTCLDQSHSSFRILGTSAIWKHRQILGSFARHFLIAIVVEIVIKEVLVSKLAFIRLRGVPLQVLYPAVDLRK